VYQLPFGHDKKYGANWNRLTDEAIGGWQLSLNAMFHSGFPATMTTYSQATGLLAAADNSNYNYVARVNQYFPMKVVDRSSQKWFGTDPSATPCKQPGGRTNTLGAPCAYGLQAGSFGTAHNGTERNPGFRNIDLSLFKGFRTVGNQYLKLRIDAYNVFNLVSLGAPNTRVGSSQFGKITTSANNPRQLQISAVYTF
jgi:hypothetical protein